MGESRTVESTVRSFLQRVEKDVEFDRSTPLYADGIGLDSLETAELSAVLEDEFGRDPFSAETMPQTVGDILDFFDTAVVVEA
ncbi:MAG: acyl carrier protein [Pseudonocardiales bacterium]|jgi:acyl carrier protein|nr:acyl carrier protein [Pseudonocardiales bacterium]